MRILVTLLALLIACSPVDNIPLSAQDLSLTDLTGSPPPDLTITVSGPTRIVQRTWTGSDGIVVKMADLYDTVEKTPCALQRASDGVARCMPIYQAFFYQDNACAVRVAHTPIGCSVEKYYTVGVNQCGIVTLSGVYRTGNKLALSKLYYISAGVCADGSTSLGEYDFYSLVAIPPSTFAAGTFNY